MIKLLFRISEMISFVLFPLTLLLCGLFQVRNSSLLITLSVIVSVIPFFLRFESLNVPPKQIMPIVVLASIAVVGRIVFAAIPNFKPVTAVVIIAGLCFGRWSGFLTGALVALGSNLFFGQGVWTPWQMYAWGMIGLIGGILAEKGLLKNKWGISIFGFLSALAYGFVMDTYVVSYTFPITLSSAITVYLAGIPHNIMHAVATVVFLFLLYSLWTKRLDRIKLKFGIE